MAHRTLEREFSSLPFILIKKALQLEELLMADRVGFEPTLGFRPKHTFQACAFNHSATYPSFIPSDFCGFGARRAPCKIKDFIPFGTVLRTSLGYLPMVATTRQPLGHLSLIFFLIQMFYLKSKKKMRVS